MDVFIHELLAPLLSGGSPAITALLLLALGGLGWLSWKINSTSHKERKELVTEFQKQIDNDRKDLMIVIDKYQEGQISVIQALNEIKVLIATLGARM